MDEGEKIDMRLKMLLDDLKYSVNEFKEMYFEKFVKDEELNKYLETTSDDILIDSCKYSQLNLACSKASSVIISGANGHDWFKVSMIIDIGGKDELNGLGADFDVVYAKGDLISRNTLQELADNFSSYIQMKEHKSKVLAEQKRVARKVIAEARGVE